MDSNSEAVQIDRAALLDPEQTARLGELIEHCMLLEGVRQSERNYAMMQAVEQSQKRRLFRTYDDFNVQDRYHRATDFFINELYAPENLAQRHSDLEKMVPFMQNWLPEYARQAVRLALRCQLMAYHLDLEVSDQLIETGVAPENLSEQGYWRAYEAVSDPASRLAQIQLIVQVGQALEGLVKRQSIYLTLKMARVPARLLGIGAVQGFLERGFKAFRSMHGADEFLASVSDRESRLITEHLDSSG